MNGSPPPASEVTQMLREWNAGNPNALDNVLPLIYDELHRQARSFLRKERPGHTLQATALINEAYLRLVDRSDVSWESRSHFFAVAAVAMRRILVDHARAKHREKRGGDNIRLSLADAMAVSAPETSVDLLDLDEALTRLGERDERQVRVVELKYFSGLSLDESAEALGISRATVAREWEMAKAWLHRELTK